MAQRLRGQPLQGMVAGRADWPGSTLRVQHPAWPGDPLRLSGEADLASEAMLNDSLQRLGTVEGAMVIDLTGLEFIDAGSVQMLVARAQALSEGERMVLRGARGVVERVLRTLGVEDLGPITVVSR
jgi:anti-anti-sigma factor